MGIIKHPKLEALERECSDNLKAALDEAEAFQFAEFDAMRRFQPDVEEVREHKGCRCGDVLRGIMAPSECPLFRKVCTPENPVGPCMVSSEGSCAAYYRYY